LANAANQGKIQLQTVAQHFIDGIKPTAWGYAVGGDYKLAINRSFLGAIKLLNQILAQGPSAGLLTALAAVIANSPVNLFIGDGSSNSAIQYRGDRNTIRSKKKKAKTEREMTPESERLQNAAIKVGDGALLPLSLLEGLAATKGSRRRKWAEQRAAKKAAQNSNRLVSSAPGDYSEF
jgi:hypothetical protein